MSADQPESPSKSQLLIYQSEDGRIRLDVRFEGETVWLTQPLMAELFQTTVPNVSMHLRNIFEEGELRPEATVQNFLTVRREGARQVTRPHNSMHPGGGAGKCRDRCFTPLRPASSMAPTYRRDANPPPR